MAYEQRDNSGSLFKNDKEGNESRPDYKGSVMVGGVEYWLSAWIKEPKSGGQKYMSLSLKPKEQDRQEYAGRDKGSPKRDLRGGDIPF